MHVAVTPPRKESCTRWHRDLFCEVSGDHDLYFQRHWMLFFSTPFAPQIVSLPRESNLENELYHSDVVPMCVTL